MHTTLITVGQAHTALSTTQDALSGLTLAAITVTGTTAPITIQWPDGTSETVRLPGRNAIATRCHTWTGAGDPVLACGSRTATFAR